MHAEVSTTEIVFFAGNQERCAHPNPAAHLRRPKGGSLNRNHRRSAGVLLR